MAEILDGKKLSQEILSGLKEEAQDLKLAVVLVGKESASMSFVFQKRKACQELGIDFELFEFDSKVTNSELTQKVRNIAKRQDISGLVIQLPLPEQIETQRILNLVPIEKDVDVLSEKNLTKFYQSSLDILPPTVSAIVELLKAYKIDIKDKELILIGAGRLVGKPLSVWLLNNKVTFSAVDRSTKDISIFTKRADILISSTGQPGLITGDMVKSDVVIIDCASLKGDIDFESVSTKASYIAPVPGGIGPMTVAMLLSNLVKMNKQN